LSEKKGLYEKGKEERSLFERILVVLPGFRGYKEKELRRESDKLIRNRTYRELDKARADLKDVFQKLSAHHVHEVLTDMDHLIMRFDRVAEKINHASYGYAGFFNILKVQEEKLDKMIAFDSGLISQAKEIVDESESFKKEVATGVFKQANNRLQKVQELLESLEETFDEREEIVLGVKE
jgi:predicted translin family RNA/ssDNA-binding protein